MSTSVGRYHHGDLKEALLQAAERMIDADVSRSFSLRELAREADVSHAAPYKHFAERGEIVLALAERWMAAFVAEQQAAGDQGDARDNLLAIGAAYVRYGHAHPARFLTIFDPTLNRPDAPATPAFAESVHQHRALLHDAVRRAAAARVLPHADLVITAAALWSQVHGLATLVMLGYLPFADTKPVLAALLVEDVSWE
jgi:AcrR family transcriptional regulator